MKQSYLHFYGEISCNFVFESQQEKTTVQLLISNRITEEASIDLAHLIAAVVNISSVVLLPTYSNFKMKKLWLTCALAHLTCCAVLLRNRNVKTERWILKIAFQYCIAMKKVGYTEYGSTLENESETICRWTSKHLIKNKITINIDLSINWKANK